MCFSHYSCLVHLSLSNHSTHKPTRGQERHKIIEDIALYASSSLYLWTIVRLNLTTPHPATHPPSPAVFSYSSFSLRWTCICLAFALQDGVTTCGFRAEWILAHELRPALSACAYVYMYTHTQTASGFDVWGKMHYTHSIYTNTEGHRDCHTPESPCLITTGEEIKMQI